MQIVKGRVLVNWVVSLEEGIPGARVTASLRGSQHPAHASIFLGSGQYDKTGSANVGGKKKIKTGFKCFKWNALLWSDSMAGRTLMEGNKQEVNRK